MSTLSVTNSKSGTFYHTLMEEKNLPEDILTFLSRIFPQSRVRIESLKENSVYKITDQSKQPPTVSVIRKSFPTWTKERRQKEVEIAKWMAASNAGPQVYNVSSDFRFMHIEYFTGGILDPNAPPDLREIGLCLRNLHSIGLPTSTLNAQDSTSFKRLHGQFERLEKLYGKLPHRLYDLYNTALEYEQDIGKYPQRALCHLDLHCHNIMRHEGRIMLVDYGMTGPDHPYFDLANFAMFMNLSPEEELELLRHYTEKEIAPQTLHQYAFFRPLAYLNKVTWSLIQASGKGGNTTLLEEILSEATEISLKEAVDWIYSQKETTATDDTRFARSALEQFFQKHREYLENHT